MRRCTLSTLTANYSSGRKFFTVSKPKWSSVPAAGTTTAPSVDVTFSQPILLEKSADVGERTLIVPAQRVLILPILHAATREFYDETLMKIHTILRGIPPAVGSEEAAAAVPQQDDNGGGNSSNTLKSKTMDGSSVALLRGKSSQGFMQTVLVEGVNGSQQDITMQREEWLRASTNVEDAQLLASAATRYASYYEDSIGGAPQQHIAATPFDELVRAYCNEYSLQFPLPPGVLLEDYYFKPLLAALAGHCLVNSDVVLAEMHPTLQQLVASQGLGCSALSSYRNSRFVDAVMANTSLDKKKKSDEGESEQGNKEKLDSEQSVEGDKIDSPWDHEAFPNGRQVTALWGHLHVPRVVELLKGMHGFKEVESSVVVGGGAAAARQEGIEVSEQVLKSISYGWDPVKHTIKS